MNPWRSCSVYPAVFLFVLGFVKSTHKQGDDYRIIHVKWAEILVFYIAEAEALLYRDFKNNKQDDYSYTYVFQIDCESCNFLLFIMHRGEVPIKPDRHWPITTSSVITQVVLLTVTINIAITCMVLNSWFTSSYIWSGLNSTMFLYLYQNHFSKHQSYLLAHVPHSDLHT